MKRLVNNIFFTEIFLHIYIYSTASKSRFIPRAEDTVCCLNSPVCDMRGVVWKGFSGRKLSSPPLILWRVASASRSKVLHCAALQPVRGVPSQTKRQQITRRLLSEYTAGLHTHTHTHTHLSAGHCARCYPLLSGNSEK